MIILNRSEKKEFIERIPEITENVFKDENEGILFSKVLTIFLEKTVSKELRQRELSWPNDVEEMKENFSKCLCVMAELATGGSQYI